VQTSILEGREMRIHLTRFYLELPKYTSNTVDERNPAWDVKKSGNDGMNYQPQVVQDFFHQH